MLKMLDTMISFLHTGDLKKPIRHITDKTHFNFRSETFFVLFALGPGWFRVVGLLYMTRICPGLIFFVSNKPEDSMDNTSTDDGASQVRQYGREVALAWPGLNVEGIDCF